MIDRTRIDEMLTDEFRIAAFVCLYGGPISDVTPVTDRYKWYTDNWGSNLNWFIEGVTGRPRPFDASVANLALGRAFADKTLRGLSWASWAGGKTSASAWYAEGDLALPNKQCLFLSWPLEVWDGRWDAFVEMATWFFDTPLAYGHAGISLNWPTLDEGQTRQHYGVHGSLLRRFHGLHPATVRDHAFNGDFGWTFTPTWLTVVSNAKLEKLGPSAMAGLPSQIDVRPLKDGSLFRLGAEPTLGDVNAKEQLPLHRDLARRLRALRAKGAWSGDYPYSSKEWLIRFD